MMNFVNEEIADVHYWYMEEQMATQIWLQYFQIENVPWFSNVFGRFLNVIR